jgi:hypothetical protein
MTAHCLELCRDVLWRDARPLLPVELFTVPLFMLSLFRRRANAETRMRTSLLSVRRRCSRLSVLMANYILIRYFGFIGGMTRENLARRHALSLLTSRTEGCTMSMLLARGVKIEMIYSLIAAGLATAHADHVGHGNVQVLRIKITDAGRAARYTPPGGIRARGERPGTA